MAAGRELLPVLHVEEPLGELSRCVDQVAREDAEGRRRLDPAVDRPLLSTYGVNEVPIVPVTQ